MTAASRDHALALRDEDYEGPDAIVFAAAPTGYEHFFENRVPQMLFGQLPFGWGILYRAYNVIPPSVYADPRPTVRGECPMSRTIVSAMLALILVAGGAIAPAAGASEPTAEWVMHEEYFPSRDGTPLHAYVFRPVWVGDAPTPVVMTISPYFNSGGRPASPTSFDPLGTPGDVRGLIHGWGDRAFLEGYTLVGVSLRGHGGSGGCIDLGGPLEQDAARAAVEWAGQTPWSNGKVAVTGHSYAGLGSLMTLARRDESYRGPDTVVVSAAPAGYEENWENGVPLRFIDPAGWWGGYALSMYYPPSLISDPSQHQQYVARVAAGPGCHAELLTGQLDPDPQSEYWRERDMARLVAGADVPVLAYHGFDDSGVPVKQIFPWFEALAGPKHAVIGSWLHVSPSFDRVLYPWLAYYLKGEPLPDELPWTDLYTVQTSDGGWRGENAFPPVDAAAWEMTLMPGLYVDAEHNFSETGPKDNLARRFPIDALEELPLQGYGAWTFSRPLEHSAHLSGPGGVSVDLETLVPGAHVIALLYEVTPAGEAVFINRGASVVPETGAVTVTFHIRPHDWRFAPGSRIGLLVTGSDFYFYESGNTGQPVRVTGGTLSLPLLGGRDAAMLPEETIAVARWERHRPFAIDASTIEEGTSPSPPPGAD